MDGKRFYLIINSIEGTDNVDYARKIDSANRYALDPDRNLRKEKYIRAAYITDSWKVLQADERVEGLDSAEMLNRYPRVTK
jgi:hypothetical protein